MYALCFLAGASYKKSIIVVKNIDFEKIQEVIDTKTDEIYSVMENLYGELLNIYKPSDEMLKFFNTSYDDFDNKVKSNNIVRMSALIFDDIHRI